MRKKIISILLALSVISAFIPQCLAAEYADISVTIPFADTNADGKNDYSLEFGTLSSYYVYDYISASEISEYGGKEMYLFKAEKNRSYFYRVTNLYDNDCVTYGNYITAQNDISAEVTKDQLYAGITDDTDFNKNTVIRDFSLNKYDTGDIYLNINEKGHLALENGETYNIYPLRNWLAVESVLNAKVIEPDFHYDIINLSGEDFLSVEENISDSSSKHRGEIKVHGNGSAIVIVTYDAMTAMGMGGESDVFYSAIYPENAGVFVVTSGIPSGTDSGMTVNKGANTADKKLSGDYIDAEHDCLYYTGSDGARYSFIPEKGTAVSVLRPEYEHGKMTFSAVFSSENITENADGSVTVGGLIEGSNIIRLENNGKTDYQVIRAKKADIAVSYQRGDEIVPADKVKAGDTVTVKFDRLYHPANKLSGVYNNTAQICYKTPDNKMLKGNSVQYTFASDAAAQTLEFEIPADYSGDSYTLTGGCIVTGSFGSAFGAHRYITYEQGLPVDFNAFANISYLCSLPDITIPLAESGFAGDVKSKKITVSAYDYTAAANHIKGASENGIILDRFTVNADLYAQTADVIKEAFDQNNINIEGLESGYVTSINNLASGEGYSGWNVSYNNDDYSNLGLSQITLSDGDEIRFDYSCNYDGFTDDIGHGWYGKPFITEFKIGNSVVKMSKEAVYDENFNITEKFYIENNQAKGEGTYENPLEIPVELSSAGNSAAEIRTNLDEHYRIISGLGEKQDFSEDVLISISSLGGKYKTYYIIKPHRKNNTGSGTGSNSGNTVSVTFRLIGASRASADVDLSKGDKGYNGSGYVTWIKTKTYKMKKGDSAYDLMTKALNDSDIDFEGSAYVTSVTAPDSYGGYKLKEFTNGSYSGWMYTVNGIHTDVPMNDYLLKNSDKIILHYVNDYRYETSYEGGSLSNGKFLNAWLSAADNDPPEEKDKSYSSSKHTRVSPTPEVTVYPETVSLAPSQTVSPAPKKTELPLKDTEPEKIFEDCGKYMWYSDAVNFVHSKNIMQGTSDKLFSPEMSINRAMLVTAIYRMEDNPDIGAGRTDFYDIGKDEWYTSAAVWANNIGIVLGYGNGYFGISDFITREQLAVILYRYAEYKGADVSVMGDLSDYYDSGQVSGFAYDALVWASEIGLMKGSSNRIMPKKYTSRAELAEIIMRISSSEILR